MRVTATASTATGFSRSTPSALGVARPSLRFWIVAGLLSVAIMFGGGGTPSPRTEMVVEFATLVAILLWAWLPATRPDTPFDRLLLVGLGIILLVPLIQLVPLPPAVWQSLPGRENELAALRTIDATSAWMPISIIPHRTIASWLALLPPVTLAFMVSRLDPEDRLRLLQYFVGLVVMAAVIGVIQVASGSARWLRFYGNAHYGFGIGFQANRNAGADLLLLGMIGLVALFAGPERTRFRATGTIAMFGLLFAFLATSVLLTGSRAGVVLLLVPMLAAVIAVRFRTGSLRRYAVILAVLATVTIAGGYALKDNPSIRSTWGRFADINDNRGDLRIDTRHALDAYWPVGSGLGSFVPVFIGAERLETVDRTQPNRAHMDYLEFALETGLAAFLIVPAVFGFAGMRGIEACRTGREGHVALFFAAGLLVILALHSLVDYPMRSIALASAFALSIGLLARPAGVARQGITGAGRK